MEMLRLGIVAPHSDLPFVVWENISFAVTLI
jgi:hypothetical protein